MSTSDEGGFISHGGFGMQLGSIDSTDDLGASLFNAAKSGNKKVLRKILERGIKADYPNNLNQTPLYCASWLGKESSVDVLLEFGANPNERCGDCGTTPVHAASIGGSVKVLDKLLEAGGDLRLHDTLGHTPKDWARMIEDAKKRRKMLEFIERLRLFAMTNSGRDIALEKQSSHYMKRPDTEAGSLTKLFRRISSTITTKLGGGESVKSVQSMGFGKIYFGSTERSGTMSTIPLVSENSLHHDDYGLTYNNGAFMVMESMTWNRTSVTVKRLHADPPKGGEVDLLINENDAIAQLRHPNVLLLMGVCQTNNLDSIVLLYERISFGSLYHYMHERFEHLSQAGAIEIMSQVCDAVIYLHQQNYLHCYMSSHAIQLVSPHLAKLGNFEYMVERSEDEYYQRKSNVIQNTYLNAAYNWIAPELLQGEAPSVFSDMYSFCSVMWEVLMGIIPWGSSSSEHITKELLENRNTLPIYKDKIPEPFDQVLEWGLDLQPRRRSLTFETFGDLLHTTANKMKPSPPVTPESPVRAKPVPQTDRTFQDSAAKYNTVNHNSRGYPDISTSEDEITGYMKEQRRATRSRSPNYKEKFAKTLGTFENQKKEEDDSVFNEPHSSNRDSEQNHNKQDDYSFIQNEKKRAFFLSQEQKNFNGARPKQLNMSATNGDGHHRRRSQENERTSPTYVFRRQNSEGIETNEIDGDASPTSPKDMKGLNKRLSRDDYAEFSAVPVRVVPRENPFQQKPPSGMRNKNANNGANVLKQRSNSASSTLSNRTPPSTSVSDRIKGLTPQNNLDRSTHTANTLPKGKSSPANGTSETAPKERRSLTLQRTSSDKTTGTSDSASPSSQTFLNTFHLDTSLSSIKPASHRLSHEPGGFVESFSSAQRFWKNGSSDASKSDNQASGPDAKTTKQDSPTQRPVLSRSTSESGSEGGMQRYRSETFLNLCGASYNDRRPRVVSSKSPVKTQPASSSPLPFTKSKSRERISPLNRQTEWFGGKGNIKGLIDSFQDKGDGQDAPQQQQARPNSNTASQPDPNRYKITRQTSAPEFIQEKKQQSSADPNLSQPKTSQMSYTAKPAETNYSDNKENLQNTKLGSNQSAKRGPHSRFNSTTSPPRRNVVTTFEGGFGRPRRDLLSRSEDMSTRSSTGGTSPNDSVMRLRQRMLDELRDSFADTAQQVWVSSDESIDDDDEHRVGCSLDTNDVDNDGDAEATNSPDSEEDKRVYLSGSGDDILFIPSRERPAVVTNGEYSGTETDDTELRSDAEPHEYYFDDDLNPSLLEENRHLHLQPPSPSELQRQRQDYINKHQRKGLSTVPDNYVIPEENGSTERLKRSPSPKRRDRLQSTDRIEKVITMNRDQFIADDKVAQSDEEDQGFSTTIKVESHPSKGGTHKITHMRTNLKTGETEILSERNVVAPTVKTQVLFDSN